MRFPGLHIYPIAQVLLLCLSIHNDTALAAPTTTTVNTTTVVVTSYAPTSTPADSYTSDTLFEETILNVTNEYRVGHNATALTWNDTLAEYADYWAKKCLWEHSHGPYGENLAEGFVNVSSSVEAWGNEDKLYNYSDPGFSEATGHFTQLVWKATTMVGCARIDCTNDSNETSSQDGKSHGWYVVCEYYPPGNVVGSNNKYFRQNVQPLGNYTKNSSESSAVGMIEGVKVSGLWAVGVASAVVLMNLNGVIL